MDPNLKRLQQELARVLADLSSDQAASGQAASAQAADKSAGTWLWHPPGKWCAAEVMEHLYLTYTGTIKGFERMMAAGEPHTTAATWRQRARKLVVLGFSYLPSGRQAPQFSRPRGVPMEKVMAEIVPKVAEMDAFIARCDEKFGAGRQLLDHPIIGPLTGAQWRKFHLVHGLHHLKQIRGLREAQRAEG